MKFLDGRHVFHLISRKLRRAMGRPVPFIRCASFGAAIAASFLAVANQSSCDVAPSVGSLHSMRTNKHSFHDVHDMNERWVASESQLDSCLSFVEVGDDR